MRKFIFLLFFTFGFLIIKTQQQNNLLTKDSLLYIQSLKYQTINDNLKEIKSEIKTNNENLEKKINEVKDDTKSIINTYVYIFAGIIAIIGFLLNFFGKDAIKKRVEEIIAETIRKNAENKIIEVLNSKLTDDLIEKIVKNKSEIEIKKILTNLEEKGNKAIDEIASKGDLAIKSLNYSKKTEFSESNDKDIEENNLINTSKELFEMALNSDDSRTKIELYKSILEINPNNISALNNLGLAYNSLTKPEEAMKYFDKAIELDETNYHALSNRAQAYNLLGELEKGIADIDKSLKVNNEFEYSYAVKGNILTKLSKFSEAERVLNKAIEINNTSGEAFFNRAYFFEERKEFLKSENDYKKAEEYGVSNYAMLYNNMAVLYRRMKKFDLAIEYLNKAKKISPDFANIDGTLALIYADKNDDENFYKFLKIALDKGCRAWEYLNDSGFDKYREETRLKMLIEPYKKKYFA